MHTPRFAVLPALRPLLLLLLLPLAGGREGTLAAQEDGSVETRGYFMAGVHRLDLDPLNRLLDERGLPPFSRSSPTLGGGGHVVIGRFRFGAEGHGLVRRAETEDGIERALGGGYGLLHVGYDLPLEEPVQAYPYVGIGGAGLSFTTLEVGAPTFEEVLDEPRRGVRLQQGIVVLHAGVGADYPIAFDELPGRRRGLTVGLRLGYTMSVWESDWHMNGYRVPAGPDLGVRGPYLRFLLGGGSR